jgi:hypothetical protein
MKKHLIHTAFLGLSLILSACGTKGDAIVKPDINLDGKNTANIQAAPVTPPVNDSGWDTIETISNRNIIAKLKPAKESPTRDQRLNEIKERSDFKKGSYGEPTDELAEGLSVQWIEGSYAIPLLEKIYGGYKGLDQAGVVFYENKASGADQSGLWIGIKKPDERLKKFMEEMQVKVDAGELKAEYIYIFHTTHTTAEDNQLMSHVNSAVSKFGRDHEKRDQLSLSTSVDTITGNIEIGHNFLTEEQKERLRKQFAEYKIVFEQEGRMVPIGDEPDTTYPVEVNTDKLSKVGAYIMGISEKGMLVVNAKAQDFSKTGGKNEFYSAISYSFPEASKKLKIGQRVIVEASGPIQESYPGRGTALYVEVLPEYKPAEADLSESQVVQAALEKTKDKNKGFVQAIRDLTYNKKTDLWTVSFKQDQELFEVEIED